MTRLSTRTSRRGFTLVELLVVIAIIAVMIAILVPTLGAIRDRALRTQCGSNMRQLTNATILYAAQRKNQLPGNSAGYNIDSLLAPQALDGIVAGNTQLRKITVCPAGSGLSYMYNPHPALRNYTQTGPWTNNTVPRWTRIHQLPKGRALFVERLREPSRLSHVISKSKEGIWNLAFADGSVREVKSQDVYEHVKVQPATSWSVFNDCLRVLELTDQRRDYHLGPNKTIPWNQDILYPFCAANDPAGD